VDKHSQLYKSIAQHGAVLESVRPRDYEIGPWLAQFVASKGCTIDAKAQAMLTDHLGTDLAKISNELGKLLLSLPEGTKKITDAHIEQNIGISKDFNNFELCKAVTGQNLEQALRIADHFARNPKDNPLLVTILALFNQFREIFRINYLRWLSRPVRGAARVHALRFGVVFAQQPQDTEHPAVVPPCPTTCGGSAATREFRFPRTRNS